MPPTFARFSGRARVPDRDRGGRQPPHLEQVPARHVAGRRISGRVAMDLAADDRPGRRIEVLPDLEEERHVPDVMQAERQQRALDDAVEREGEAGVPGRRPAREGVDRPPDRRPDDAQDDAGDDARQRRDDRHEALAREEAEIGRQLDPVVPVEQPSGDAADDDAAEDTRLDRLDAHDGLRLVAEHRAPSRPSSPAAPRSRRPLPARRRRRSASRRAPRRWRR